jgi:hypothetical protein
MDIIRAKKTSAVARIAISPIGDAPKAARSRGSRYRLRHGYELHAVPRRGGRPAGHFVVVPAMVLVTKLAAYIPARRASRIAPTLALRYE